ncbi:MAG: hypothetical protein RIT19_139 [Verrucomicrobiota bacterium]|jgi:hypothetical protein
MRLQRKDADGASWLLTPGERDLLLALFSRPPNPRPPARLSRTSGALDERARTELAGELEAHRIRVRARLAALFQAASEASSVGSPSEVPGPQEASGWILHLTPEDQESLLQALNELRLGAWEALGRPDPPEVPASLAPSSPDITHWWTLELASRFQGRILSAESPG